MRENVARILKQHRFGTLGGTINFHVQQWRKYNISTCTSSRDNYKVSVWLATGIRKYLDIRKQGTHVRQLVNFFFFSPSFSHHMHPSEQRIWYFRPLFLGSTGLSVVKMRRPIRSMFILLSHDYTKFAVHAWLAVKFIYVQYTHYPYCDTISLTPLPRRNVHICYLRKYHTLVRPGVHEVWE